MYIAMNRFKVVKDADRRFRAGLARARQSSRRDGGLRRVPPAAGARARGPRPLRVAHDLVVEGRFRGLDPLGAVPQGARPRADDEAALPRASAVRGFRDDPDRRRSRERRRRRFVRPALARAGRDSMQPAACQSSICQRRARPCRAARNGSPIGQEPTPCSESDHRLDGGELALPHEASRPSCPLASPITQDRTPVEAAGCTHLRPRAVSDCCDHARSHDI